MSLLCVNLHSWEYYFVYLILICTFSAKPISLVERCYCRSTVNNLPRGYIRELRFIHTPNCPFQVMWVLWDFYVDFSGGMISIMALKIQTCFAPCWTFLTINLREATGQRKELRVRVFAHAPLSLAHTFTESKAFLQLARWRVRRK